MKKTMAILQMFGCLLLLSGAVPGRPRVFDVPPHSVPAPPPVIGSLILHYDDNTTYKIHYDSSSLECHVNFLPNKKITKVEVNSAQFVLYSRRNWRGRAAAVSSVGYREFSTEEILGITRVKSVRQQGCGARNKT